MIVSRFFVCSIGGTFWFQVLLLVVVGLPKARKRVKREVAFPRSTPLPLADDFVMNANTKGKRQAASSKCKCYDRTVI